MRLSDLRADAPKKHRRVNEKDLLNDPFDQFSKWLKLAIKTNPVNPNAMILSTATKKGKVSLRTVLLKYFDTNGFIFFSNYGSKKGKNLFENPSASILFFWRNQNRQIIINGKIKKTSKKVSEDYFRSRPRESQLMAYTSKQSTVISSHKTLETKMDFLRKKYKDIPIPLPKDWGGYLLKPDYFEFWQCGSHRFHDRYAYSLKKGKWEIKQLSP